MGSRESPKELIDLARTGDAGAKEILVDRFSDALDHFIRLRLGSHLLETIEAEDVFQETFAKVFRSLETFQWRGEESFLRWLKGIAENRILTVARSQRRSRLVFVNHDERPSDEVPPSRTARREERFDRLQRALDRLEPDYREVIVLARLKGLRLKEVAERMERSPNAVAHLLSRALAKLKEVFGNTESLTLPARRIDSRVGEGKRDEI